MQAHVYHGDFFYILHDIVAVVLYIYVNCVSVISRQFSIFPGWTSVKQRIKSLAQGQNTMTPLAMSLELTTLRFPV